MTQTNWNKNYKHQKGEVDSSLNRVEKIIKKRRKDVASGESCNWEREKQLKYGLYQIERAIQALYLFRKNFREEMSQLKREM